MTSVCPNGHTSTAADYCDVCGAPIDTTPADGTGQPSPAPAAGGGTAPPSRGSGTTPCPHCGTENVSEALFCEACGYDFTTGTLPRTDSGEGPATEPEAAVDTATPGRGTPGPETAGRETPGPQTSSPSAAGTQATPGSPVPVSSPVPAGADFQYVAEVWIDPAWYEAQQAPDPMPSPGLPEVVPLRKSSVLVGRVSRSRNIHPDIDCEPDSGASRRQAQLTTDGTRWWVEDLESANGTFVAGSADPLPDSPIAVGLKQEIQPGDRIYVGAWTRIVVRQATPEEHESLV